MTAGSELQKDLRRYLLGQLDERTAEALEEQFLLQDEIFEELLVAEDELIEEYLAEALTAEDRRALENHFLSTPDRLDQLRFGRTFRRYLSRRGPVTSGEVSSPVDLAPAEAHPSVPPKTKSLTWWSSPRAFFASPWRAVAFAALVLAVGFGAWSLFIRHSAVDEGLLALNSAYREQRPLESRISNFDYAPYVVTRGPGDERIDRNKLSRAELTLLNELETKPSPAVHHALCKVYLAKKDFEKAIDEFNESLKGDPNNAQTYSDLGAAWLEKGKLTRDGQDSGKSLAELGVSLENLNKALAKNPNLLEALFNRALCYQYMMASREAEASWREYIQKDPNSSWAEDAKRHLKRLEEDRNNTSRSTGSAVLDFLAAQHRQDDAVAWNVIVQNYSAKGNEVANGLLEALLQTSTSNGVENPASGLKYLAKLELERTGDRFTSDLINHLEKEIPEQRPALAEAQRKMRSAYDLFTSSKYKDAIDNYSEARLAYERLGNTTAQLFTEYRLAHCFLFLKDLPQAELILARLSVTCQARHYQWLVAQCFYGLSHASYDQSQFSKAVDYSARALSAFEHTADMNGILKALTQLAQANQILNRIDRALEYLNKALMLSVNSPVDPMAKWGMFLQVAFDMKSQGFHDAALIYQREALQVALQIGWPLITSRSYGYLGSAYAAAKNYDEALAAARRALQTGESMPDSASGREIAANAAQQLGDIYRESGACDQAIQNYNKSIDIYAQLKIDYYSYAAHKGKLFCFVLTKNDSATEEELAKVLALFDEYRAKITDENERVSFFANQQNLYDLAIYYEAVRRGDANRAYQYSEESRARTLLDEIQRSARMQRKNKESQVDRTIISRSMSLDEIQKGMPANTQILQYAVLDDRLMLWVLTPSAIHATTVPIRSDELNQTVHSFFEIVDNPSDPKELPPQAKNLYRILIAPVESFLDKSQYLCIVPDKALNYVPFQALMSPASGRYLIEDHILGTAPSATIFVTMGASSRAKAEKSEEQVLSVGNPHFNRNEFENLSDLRSAAMEAKAVSGLYRKNHLLLRDEATETKVRSEMELSDVVHLAMHYVVNDQMAMLSGFPLAPETSGAQNSTDGFLQSYEIQSLKLTRTRLVILSGCQTATGRQYAGEGAMSAARPFMIAGVPTVVATLWPVDSEASAELMISFHAHRTRDHLPPAEALRRAQIEMARGDDATYHHPYYWSAFQAIGGFTTY